MSTECAFNRDSCESSPASKVNRVFLYHAFYRNSTLEHLNCTFKTFDVKHIAWIITFILNSLHSSGNNNMLSPVCSLWKWTPIANKMEYPTVKTKTQLKLMRWRLVIIISILTLTLVFMKKCWRMKFVRWLTGTRCTIISICSRYFKLLRLYLSIISVYKSLDIYLKTTTQVTSHLPCVWKTSLVVS